MLFLHSHCSPGGHALGPQIGRAPKAERTSPCLAFHLGEVSAKQGGRYPRASGPQPGAASQPSSFKSWGEAPWWQKPRWGPRITTLDRLPADPVLGGPPRPCHLAALQSSLTGGCGPFPEQSCPPPASRAKESKVSSFLSVRWPKAGPRAQVSHLQLAPAPPASADSPGSLPASCVINQPEVRQSALGKRNVWCALVFSSNCSMARSACKIFQNKAIDGNYISHWEPTACGLCRRFVKNTPRSDRHASSRAAGAGPGLEGGAVGAARDGQDPGRPLLRPEGLRRGADHGNRWASGLPGICLTCLIL